eukprot:GHVN01101473.1.p2 GENE.GHVN01101473.1~~GHVN01101473.1.p2  ORF type:complete len:130 (+),score=20.28 GHVN01101473.1:659-1048(+)
MVTLRERISKSKDAIKAMTKNKEGDGYEMEQLLVSTSFQDTLHSLLRDLSAVFNIKWHTRNMKGSRIQNLSTEDNNLIKEYMRLKDDLKEPAPAERNKERRLSRLRPSDNGNAERRGQGTGSGIAPYPK